MMPLWSLRLLKAAAQSVALLSCFQPRTNSPPGTCTGVFVSSPLYRLPTKRNSEFELSPLADDAQYQQAQRSRASHPPSGERFSCQS